MSAYYFIVNVVWTVKRVEIIEGGPSPLVSTSGFLLKFVKRLD